MRLAALPLAVICRECEKPMTATDVSSEPRSTPGFAVTYTCYTEDCQNGQFVVAPI